MRAALAAALVLVLALAPGAGPRQDAPGDASALYPCPPPGRVVRFFHLEEDEPDMGRVSSALAELGAELAYGPRTTSGWPGNAFVAVRAAPETSAKKLAAALKKGGGAAHELVCVAFDGRTGAQHDFGLGGFGVTTRDVVRGISSDVVWYDATGAWSQFYGRAGKLDPDELAKRYEKLYAPYGGAKLGALVSERFTWPLASAPEDDARARVQKELARVPGVVSAQIEGASLTVTVRLAELASCADVGKLAVAGAPLDAAGADVPRAAFDTTPVHALLRSKDLLPR